MGLVNKSTCNVREVESIRIGYQSDTGHSVKRKLKFYMNHPKHGTYATIDPCLTGQSLRMAIARELKGKGRQLRLRPECNDENFVVYVDDELGSRESAARILTAL